MTKVACLIAINYDGPSALAGCINDAENTKEMLVTQLGYEEENVRMVLQEEATRDGIYKALGETVVLCDRLKAKECWISYSGHGIGVPGGADEADGRNECIIPFDGRRITDDEIHRFVSRLPSCTHTTMVWDCCHSGTGADLQYHYGVSDTAGRPVRAPVIMVSGCQDKGTSADAYGLEGEMEFTGAMTTALLKTLAQHKYEVTVGVLLKAMRRYLVANRFTQVPQVTSSVPISKSTKFVTKTAFNSS